MSAFRFDVGDQVIVDAGSVRARVTGVMREAGNSSDMYRVIWWNGRERHERWLYDFELEPASSGAGEKTPAPPEEHLGLEPVARLADASAAEPAALPTAEAADPRPAA